MDIKPIETVYKGYRFRSRLEARWAVFFDTLGIKWEYEKEGYDLDGTWYLPDFWLPEWRNWVEIKSEYPSRAEIEKCCKLAKATRATCFLIYGQPWMYSPESEDEGIYYYTKQTQWEYRFLMLRGNEMEPLIGAGLENESIWDAVGIEKHVFAGCRRCPALNFLIVEHDGASGFGSLESCCDTDRYPLADTPRLLAAYTAARQARFEHGEHP